LLVVDKVEQQNPTSLRATLGLLQGWLDIGAIGHFIAIVLHLGWTNIAGLLSVNLYFYIFNQLQFRADVFQNPNIAKPCSLAGIVERH